MDEGVKRITTTLVILFAFSKSSSHEKINGLIYILEWTPIEPFNYLSEGQDPFISRNCLLKNCFITNRSSYFENLMDFDVLLFNAAHLSPGIKLPSNRSQHQIYIFFGWDSAAYFPIPSYFDEFFNLTWTYKLTSDIVLPYIVIKNKYNQPIGPRIDSNWLDINNMAPINKQIKQELQNKSIAAAWVASNCYALNDRQDFAYDLKNELSQYGLRLDIYGQCGSFECGKFTNEVNDTTTECSNKIKSDYYFYLAFENSFSEDYVTEKVLYGLNNLAVPIVYGGANYTRFMPDGIYLDARNLAVSTLAREIKDIIWNRSRYYQFFKWHQYYSYHDTKKDDFIDTLCALCSLLNKKTLGSERTVYKSKISQWWNVSEFINIPPSNAPGASASDVDISAIDEVIYEQQSESTISTPKSVSEKIIALLSDVANYFDW